MSAGRHPRLVARLAARLYPAEWRERYGEELAGVLEDGDRAGPGVILDLVRGAIDAHVHPQPCVDAPRRTSSGLRRMVVRTATVWAAFGAAGFVAAKSLEGTDLLRSSGARAATDTVSAAFLLACLALGASLLPLVLVGAYRALRSRDVIALSLIAVSGLAPGLVFCYPLLIRAVFHSPVASTHHGLASAAAMASWGLVALLGVAVGGGALNRALRRCSVPESVLCWSGWPAVVTTGMIGASAAGLLLLDISLAAFNEPALAVAKGLLQTPAATSLGMATAFASVAAFVALRDALRGLSLLARHTQNR